MNSGGLYYASAVLAPEGWGPLAAWLTGWSNFLGQVTGAPSVDYGLCAMILASASITNPDYVPTEYQTFLLTSFVMIIHAMISSMPTKWIAIFNSYGTMVNIGALIVVIILIPADCKLNPRFQPSKQVWGTIENGTDYPDGIAVLMSFVAVM
jgi:amino acid transporter